MHNKKFLFALANERFRIYSLDFLFVTESLRRSVLRPSAPTPPISAVSLTRSEPRARHHQQQFLIGPPPATRYTLPRNKTGSPTDAAGPWVLRSDECQQQPKPMDSNCSLQHPALFAQQIAQLAPTQYRTWRSAGDARSVQLGRQPSPLLQDLSQPQLHAHSSEQHCLCAFAPIETLVPMPMPLSQPISPSTCHPQCAPAQFVASSPSDPSENYDNLLVPRRMHNARSDTAPQPQQRHIARQPAQATSERDAVEQVEKLVHQLQRVQPQAMRPLAQPQHPFAPPIPLHRSPIRPAHSDLRSDSELHSSGAQSLAFSACRSERIESGNQHEQLLQPSARSSSLIR